VKRALATLLGLEAAEGRSVENPQTPLTPEQLVGVLGLVTSASGKSVTPVTARTLPAVFACVAAIAESLAMLPLKLYRREPDGSRVELRDDPRHRVLYLEPNAEMSSFDFRRSLITNRLLGGNGYAEIVRNGRGQVVELWPIPWHACVPFWSAGELRYRVTRVDGRQITLLRRDVLHVRGFTLDGIVGISAIAECRNAIGGALATEEFAGAFFRNGTRHQGIIESPKALDTVAAEKLSKSFTDSIRGEGNGRVPVIPLGMTWKQITMPLQDAQFIETRQFQIEDVCRMFRVPPHKIQHLLRSTNNNIEEQGQEWLTDTLQPHMVGIEQEIGRKCFDAEESRGGLYVEHLADAILRADTEKRAKSYQARFATGSITPDEIRKLENDNPLPEGRGSVAYVPANFMPALTPKQADAVVAKGVTGGTGTSKPADPGAEDPVDPTDPGAEDPVDPTDPGAEDPVDPTDPGDGATPKL
jgi:HK97 family phage portal protein